MNLVSRIDSARNCLANARRDVADFKEKAYTHEDGGAHVVPYLRAVRDEVRWAHEVARLEAEG